MQRTKKKGQLELGHHRIQVSVALQKSGADVSDTRRCERLAPDDSRIKRVSGGEKLRGKEGPRRRINNVAVDVGGTVVSAWEVRKVVRVFLNFDA